MKWRVWIALCMVVNLAGCQLMSLLPEAKKINYKSAGKLPPLEVPPDLTAPGSDERYVVPDISPTGSATFSAYSKDRTKLAGVDGAAVLPAADETGVRMERSGTQRWVVVKGEPEDIWPVVKNFWQELGFIIKLELPEAGVMETDWAENRAKIPDDLIRSALSKILDTLYSTAERDKFRTRLERGETGTTEIYISHRGMDEVMEGNVRTVWQPRPPDPDLEAEMLSRLMIRFGATEERARSSMASAGTARERARLGEKGRALTVNEAYDRAWRRVGLALDRIGFTVEDRNRSQGIYYVRYVNPDEDSGAGTGAKGLLSKLIFWSQGEDTDQPGQYRIQLSEAGQATDVKVLNKEGGAEKSSDATKILKLLYDQLK
ncbi:MAG TPA: outer membrane protein assembly factor BamC [Nitrosospira sp.]|nr:outer membrane protein assembly factor BamC [Nitrosospira sp.]